jgi:hypothetical protein
MTCTTSSTGTAVKCATFWREPAATALIGCGVLLTAGSVGQTASSKRTSGRSGKPETGAGLASGASRKQRPLKPRGAGYLELQRLKANALVSPPVVALFGRFNDQEGL